MSRAKEEKPLPPGWAPYQKLGCVYCAADLPHEKHITRLEAEQDEEDLAYLDRLAQKLKACALREVEHQSRCKGELTHGIVSKVGRGQAE